MMTIKHPDEVFPLMKLKLASKQALKQLPSEPHWAFCYSLLHKLSRSFAFVIQQLDPQVRDAVSEYRPELCKIYYQAMTYMPLFFNDGIVTVSSAGVRSLFGS